ncbi:hypothetical protein FRC12_018091 [Ceratobasidium sp. 428]|nr:hypothetical protein FRC12_018091 [Ceratobasidium sp. 428]
MPAQRRQRTTRRSSPAPLRPKSTNVPTPSKLLDRRGDDSMNLDTLTEEVTAVEQSVASPTHSVQNATTVSADTPGRERAPEHTHNGEDEPTKKGPIDSPHNPFAPTSPDNSQSSKPTTLHEAIQSPAARTGNPFVDRALNHVRKNPRRKFAVIYHYLPIFPICQPPPETDRHLPTSVLIYPLAM